MQLGGDGEDDPVAGVVGGGRPRPVGGQVQLLRQAGQLLLPVGELPSGEAVGVAVVAEYVALQSA